MVINLCQNKWNCDIVRISAIKKWVRMEVGVAGSAVNKGAELGDGGEWYT